VSLAIPLSIPYVWVVGEPEDTGVADEESEAVGDVEGPLVKVGLTEVLLEGEGDWVALGPNEIMLRAKRGTTVATTMTTMSMAASTPLFMCLPARPGGGGGGGG